MRWVFARVRESYLVGGLSGIFLGFVAIGTALFAAWVTHVVWVIGKLASDQGVTGGQLLLGLLGFFVPPIGVVHGIMVWFGVGF